MKFYLAAKWERHQEMRAYRTQLEEAGHHVMSRWIDVEEWENQTAVACALGDLVDIERADVVICFMGDEKSVGRHVEFGYALGRGIMNWIVGPEEGIFYTLADRHFDTFADVLQFLNQEPEVEVAI